MTTLTRQAGTQPGLRRPLGASLRALLTRRAERAHANPYLGGAILGVVLFLAFFLTGNGLGASGALNRIVVWVEDLVWPGHIDRVAYLLKMAGGAKNALDDWIVFMTIGTLVGGFASGWWHGRLRLETGKGPRLSNRQRWFFAFWGAASWAMGRGWRAGAPRGRRSRAGRC